MTNEELSELERDMEFAMSTKREHFYISKTRLRKLINDYRTLKDYKLTVTSEVILHDLEVVKRHLKDIIFYLEKKDKERES